MPYHPYHPPGCPPHERGELLPRHQPALSSSTRAVEQARRVAPRAGGRRVRVRDLRLVVLTHGDFDHWATPRPGGLSTVALHPGDAAAVSAAMAVAERAALQP